MTNTLSRMRFYDRQDRNLDAYYTPDTTLLPREVFEGNDNVLREYDRMVELTNARRDHLRDEKAARALAATAAADYRTKVKEALATGKDASKVKNDEPRHLAEADAHAGFAATAKVEAKAQGHKLGKAVAELAASFFGPADTTLEEARTGVEACLTDLRKSWATWSDAWQVRRILSDAHHKGGMLPNFTPDPRLPAEVVTAIATIEEHLSNHDQLRADEIELSRWRQEQADAEAANLRSIGHA